MEQNGLAIIFHSGSYDKVYHGLTLALTALALGREVKMLFSYWALDLLRKECLSTMPLDKEAEDHKTIIKQKMEQGNLDKLCGFMSQAKNLGAKLYVCVSSMALMNVTRDELIEEVDASMGLTTFLTETAKDQIIFI
jgi:peroxiredoxin family protein